jgi:hypothetical protein
MFLFYHTVPLNPKYFPDFLGIFCYFTRILWVDKEANSGLRLLLFLSICCGFAIIIKLIYDSPDISAGFIAWY